MYYETEKCRKTAVCKISQKYDGKFAAFLIKITKQLYVNKKFMYLKV